MQHGAHKQSEDTHKSLTMFYINARSVKNKHIYLNDYISSHAFDIVAISETWLGTSDIDDTCINGLVPNGYNILRADRNDGRRGGGVALLYKQWLNIKCSNKRQYKQFECLQCSVSLNKNTTQLYVVYRPPPSADNGLTTNDFLNEWADFLSQQVIINAELLIVGDINIHVENITLCHTRIFTQTLESCGLQQHVKGATHYIGHTLDVLISRDTSKLISKTKVIDIGLCDNQGNIIRDHYSVTCKMNIPHASCTNRQLVSYRKLRDINVQQFQQDIIASVALNSTTGNVETLTERYIEGLCSLIDLHAPLLHRIVTLRPHAPWYTETLRDAKRLRRKLERIWRRKQLEIDRQRYRQQCARITILLTDTKLSYYSNKINECNGNTKALYKLTEKLLVNQHNQTLPSGQEENTLANSFGTYFEDKIVRIRNNLTFGIDDDEQQLTPAVLGNFKPADSSEIRILIMSYTNKSCELDPIPTWLLKQCIAELLPLITSIMNTSMQSGVFPSSFKTAIIRPHIKKPNLDHEDLKNYRPVSNLHFLSKILEKLVANRIDEHLGRNQLHDPNQSAYRKKHSTETAMIRISNDIIQGLDQGKQTMLASLDLSAAFDTVDHQIFLHRLKTAFGVNNVVLSWFHSYLQDRQYNVCIKETLSSLKLLTCGVPQGSVLGARMYTMYVRPLADIIKKHNVMYHFYADDTQIYVQCSNTPDSILEAKLRLQTCIHDVCTWMSKNALKINTEKTEFIVFNTTIDHHTHTTLNIGPDTIQPCEQVKILGVILDRKMTLEKQISNICRTAYMHIRKINSIRGYLNEQATKTLVQSNVITRLDYCNGLYTGLPKRSTYRLKLTLNSAARLVSLTPFRQHITPVLENLNWLPITSRCQYKSLVLTFKILHNDAPIYLNDVLNLYQPRRALRSATTTSLTPGRNKTVRYGQRILATSAAVLWNCLPLDIKHARNLDTFKTLLKLHLASSDNAYSN